MGLDLAQLERVEVGLEMAAYAVGTDQHQRADRIKGRGADIRGCGPAGPSGDGGDCRQSTVRALLGAAGPVAACPVDAR